MKLVRSLLAAAALLAAAGAALADINVGVTVSATGPAASLGIPEKNTIALMPGTIAGQKVNYIVLDDASDTTRAVSNTRKLISEDKVDVILGSTTTPNSLAMIDAVAEAQTPMISMAAVAASHWVFKTSQSGIIMALVIAKHMADNGVKKIGFISSTDAYGDGWYQNFSKAAAHKRLEINANKRYYAGNDAGIDVENVLNARPDAVLIAGPSGTVVEWADKFKRHGYHGKIYLTEVNNFFLSLDGSFMPASPVLVAEQLPADHPVKKSALDYISRYEAAHGKGSASTFGAHVWDAGLLMSAAVPVALKKAKPGTPEFRAALRDALEGVKNLAGAHGVFNMSAGDHLGLDQRARVMVRVQNNKFKYDGDYKDEAEINTPTTGCDPCPTPSPRRIGVGSVDTPSDNCCKK